MIIFDGAYTVEWSGGTNVPNPITENNANFSIAFWFKNDTTHSGQTRFLIGLWDENAVVEIFQLYYSESEPCIRLYMQDYDNGLFADMAWEVDLTEGVWHHVCFVWSGTNATVYLDGEAATQSSNYNPDNIDGSVMSTIYPRLCVGEMWDAMHWTSARMKELATWGSALGGSDIAALAAGAAVENIASGSRLGAWPLDSSGVDQEGSYTLTVTGASFEPHRLVTSDRRLVQLRTGGSLSGGGIISGGQL